MTAACGLANSFVTLFLMRVGVGIGETTAAPCSFSLFGDYFPKEIRPRAVALFMLGAPAGAGVTYIIGGQIVEYIAQSPSIVIPIFGELMAWQSAFLIVGLPGLLVSLMVLITVREPKRQEVLSEKESGPTLSEAASYMLEHKSSYASLFGGIIGITAIGAASFWIPALYERTWGWTVSQTGMIVGTILIVSGIIGTTGGGWVASQLIKRGINNGPYYTVLSGALLVLPCAVMYPLAPSAEIASIIWFVGMLGMSVTSGTSPSCIIAITPGELRGQATVIFFFVLGLFGSLVGPTLVGYLTDLSGDPAFIKYSLSITGLLFGFFMNISLLLGFKKFKQSADILAQRTFK
jgi:MFS family permease